MVTALAAIFIASVLAKPVLPGFDLKARPWTVGNNQPATRPQTSSKWSSITHFPGGRLAISVFWIFTRTSRTLVVVVVVVLYYVMIKSVAIAIRGPIVGWGKLERKATAAAGP
jgi:hypothetical protein